MAINFSIFSSGDAYFSGTKIMGRQKNGESFLRSILQETDSINIYGTTNLDVQNFLNHLRKSNWSGSLRGATLSSINSAIDHGTIYYPAPSSEKIAWARAANNLNMSIMGITHTICTEHALKTIGNLILKPYESWDGLICTSQASMEVIQSHLERIRKFYRDTHHIENFNKPQLKKIPLGINLSDFKFFSKDKQEAKKLLNIENNQIVILSAGRLSFSSKQNPGPLYIALSKVAEKHRVTLIESGIYPSDYYRKHYEQAASTLLPNVKRIFIDGNDSLNFKNAWLSADIFVSLPDNIQETFGITPLEAMAYNLPVIGSDWDGYRDNIQHGKNGFLIPTTSLFDGTLKHLSNAYMLGSMTYDMYIAKTSMAVHINIDALTYYLDLLCSNKALRAKMGDAGHSFIKKERDWKIILNLYNNFSDELNSIRKSSNKTTIYQNPYLEDPSLAFKSFPTKQLNKVVRFKSINRDLFQKVKSLMIFSYTFEDNHSILTAMENLLTELVNHQEYDLSFLMQNYFGSSREGMLAISSLIKFGVLNLSNQTIQDV